MKQIFYVVLLLPNFLAAWALLARKLSGRSSDAVLGAGNTSSSEQAKTMRHVVYTADSKVFGALLRSMQSLSLHLSAPERCRIHLIVPQADLDQASKLVQCFRAKVQATPERQQKPVPEVVLHKVRPMPIAADYRDRSDLQGHETAYARLFLPEYLPDVSRAVYLDTDTLLRGDLAPLFERPMSHALAAVEEGTSFNDLWSKWYSGLAQHVLDPNQSIFNDGVLVLDIQRWKAENISADIQSWAVNSGAAVDDQLLLNLEFQVTKNFDRLPHEWNDFRVRPTGWPAFGWSDEMRPEDELSHAQILHWTGPKPWEIPDPQMKQEWMDQYSNLWEVTGFNGSSKCDAALS